MPLETVQSTSLSLSTPRAPASLVSRLTWLVPVLGWLVLLISTDPAPSSYPPASVPAAVLDPQTAASSSPVPDYAVLPEEVALQLLTAHQDAIFSGCRVRGTRLRVRVMFGPDGIVTPTLLTPRRDDTCVASVLPTSDLPTSGTTVSYDLDLVRTRSDGPASARRNPPTRSVPSERVAPADPVREVPESGPEQPGNNTPQARRPERIW